MKIYTKTGDEGLTGLYGGGRVPKSSLRIDALGDVDELNASLGICLSIVSEPSTRTVMEEVQRRLFDIGAEIAGSVLKTGAGIVVSDIKQLEDSIDELTSGLPPLRAFVLPGGSPGAASTHFARTVCRRCERTLLKLHEHEPVRTEVRIYLNRLSDWLFTAARTSNLFDRAPEVEWHPRKD